MPSKPPPATMTGREPRWAIVGIGLTIFLMGVAAGAQLVRFAAGA